MGGGQPLGITQMKRELEEGLQNSQFHLCLRPCPHVRAPLLVHQSLPFMHWYLPPSHWEDLVKASARPHPEGLIREAFGEV